MPDDTIDDTTKENEIAARLEKSLDHKLKGEQTLARVVADPDVRKVLEAKQAGRKLKIEDLGEGGDGDGGAPALDFDSVDFDSMTNKDVAKFVLSEFTKVLSTTIAPKLKSVEDSVSLSTNFIRSQEDRAVQGQIKSAREKFSDFDDLKADMLMIHQQNPGLSVEELYFMSKLRKGTFVSPTVASEKPSSVGTRPEKRTERKTPLPPGRRGFAAILAESLDKDA